MRKVNYLIRPLLFFLAIGIAPLTSLAQQYQTLSNAKAYVEDGKVVISAFKSMRYFTNEEGVYDTIRVYRQLCPDFVFNTDYEEYFTKLDHRDAELIFEGSVNPILQSKYCYLDRTSRKDSVYAYWIGTSTHVPYGPLPVKVRDESVWWTYQRVAETAHGLERRFTDRVKVDTIGYSVNRTPILGLKVGTGRPVAALIGAVHPGESGPEIIMSALESLLIQYDHLLDNQSVLAIPSVSPDQRDAQVRGVPWYLRKNSNRVDINRNFPADWKEISYDYRYSTNDPEGPTYRGPFAGSEPETAAVAAFLKHHQPKAVFSFHCLGSIAGEALLAARSAATDYTYKQKCNEFAAHYWKGMGVKKEEQKSVAFRCAAGSLPAWCYLELGIPAFDVEAPYDAIDRARCVADKTDTELLAKYQKKHLQGLVELLTRIRP